MCTTEYRHQIMAGTLAAALFDRGQIRLTYPDRQLAGTPERAVECQLARRALAETAGEQMGKTLAEAASSFVLRQVSRNPAKLRQRALRAAPWAGLVTDRSSPLFDAVAVEAFVSSFSAAVIDCRDDRAYHALAAA